MKDNSIPGTKEKANNQSVAVNKVKKRTDSQILRKNNSSPQTKTPQTNIKRKSSIQGSVNKSNEQKPIYKSLAEEEVIKEINKKKDNEIIQNYFVKIGVKFDQGAQLAYVSDASRLVVTNNKIELDKIINIVNILEGGEFPLPIFEESQIKLSMERENRTYFFPFTNKILKLIKEDTKVREQL